MWINKFYYFKNNIIIIFSKNTFVSNIDVQFDVNDHVIIWSKFQNLLFVDFRVRGGKHSEKWSIFILILFKDQILFKNYILKHPSTNLSKINIKGCMKGNACDIISQITLIQLY